MTALLALWLGVAAWAVTITPLPTEPGCPHYLEAVVELIEGAESEVLVMISDLRYYGPEERASAPAIALSEAAARGVEVRVLVNLWRDPWPSQQRARDLLEGSGADFRWWQDPDASLHAKALVVDGRWVLVGSSHWTWNALLESVQVDLLIESDALAAHYTEFFEFLWEGEGPVEVELAPPPWPSPSVVPLLQPPRSELHVEVLPELIADAERTVEVLLYRMARYPAAWDSPSNRLVDALSGAAARGAHVRVVLEGGEDFMDETTIRANREAAAYLLLSGVDTRLDRPGETMHAKCLIVDGRHVVVTSANWSYYSLARHAEIGVVLLAVPEVAAQLQALFERVWGRSLGPLPSALQCDLDGCTPAQGTIQLGGGRADRNTEANKACRAPYAAPGAPGALTRDRWTAYLRQT